LEDGSQWGLAFSYAVQEEPRGLADAFIVGREFVGRNRCALILGDNLFYGHDLSDLRQAAQREDGATVFAYQVGDPERYGVISFDGDGVALALGTHESLLDAAEFVRAIEQRQAVKIACVEEVAYRMGYLDRNTLHKLGTSLQKSGYGDYLCRIADEEFHSGLVRRELEHSLAGP
jgi:dTDP-glucose pyrophosphorylase